MGQAFRRASGRIGSARPDTTPQRVKLPVDGSTPQHPPVSVDKLSTGGVTRDSEGASRVNTDNVLEKRDPQYDAMLGQMVGRIRAKPGGKLEMGEAAVVENYKRPLPKLRNTKPESSRYEDKPAPPGTLNVSQIRQIILLYQGKSEEHNGPMNIPQIAERFRVDAALIQSILKSVTLPPEDDTKRRNDQV